MQRHVTIANMLLSKIWFQQCPTGNECCTPEKSLFKRPLFSLFPLRIVGQNISLTMLSKDKFLLYSFYSSSCCQRIIIAAHLKSIPLEFSFVKLGERQHHSDEYTRNLNPSASVPTLVVQHPDGGKTIIRQSVSILEYFEERFPDQNPLLPSYSYLKERAMVRDFMNIISNDTQPPTNSRIAKRVKAIRDSLEDQVAFVEAAFRDGLGAYESLLVQSRGETGDQNYSVGQRITLADVCLIPAVDQALIYRLNLDFAPNVMRIYSHLKPAEAFQKADWRNQEDTPERYRAA